MLRALGKSAVFSIDLRGTWKWPYDHYIVNCAWNSQLMFLSGQQICLCTLLSLMHQTYLLGYIIASCRSSKNYQNLTKVVISEISLWETGSLLLLLSNGAKDRWRQWKRQRSRLNLANLNAPPKSNSFQGLPSFETKMCRI